MKNLLILITATCFVFVACKKEEVNPEKKNGAIVVANPTAEKALVVISQQPKRFKALINNTNVKIITPEELVGIKAENNLYKINEKKQKITISNEDKKTIVQSTFVIHKNSIVADHELAELKIEYNSIYDCYIIHL